MCQIEEYELLVERDVTLSIAPQFKTLLELHTRLQNLNLE